jgi:hypothetical protein
VAASNERIKRARTDAAEFLGLTPEEAVRSLLRLGATREDVGRVIARAA